MAAGPATLSRQPAPGLAGRRPELDTIAAAISAAAAGTPALVLVEGEKGAGRTTLIRRLEDSPLLPRNRIRVVSLEAAEDGDAVMDAAAQLTRLAVYARFGGRRRVAAAIRKVMPDWISAIPGWGDLLEAITVTIAAVRRRRRPEREKVSEELEALYDAARRHAAAILIDDGERLSPQAADRLVRLVRAADQGIRLFVLVAWRPPPPGTAPPPLIRAAATLPSSRLVRVALAPLDAAGVGQCLEERLGGSVSAALVHEILETTGGLPGAIMERVAQLQAADSLRRVEEGWTAVPRPEHATAPSSPGVVDLGPLGEDVRATLRVAARLDEPFTALAVAGKLERDELWVEDRLAAAARLGVLHLIDDAFDVDGDITSCYRFASAALRAALRHSA